MELERWSCLDWHAVILKRVTERFEGDSHLDVGTERKHWRQREGTTRRANALKLQQAWGAHPANGRRSGVVE